MIVLFGAPPATAPSVAAGAPSIARDAPTGPADIVTDRAVESAESSIPNHTITALSIAWALLAAACLGLILWKRLYDPAAAPEPPMGRVADWPVILLGGAVVWVAQVIGLSTAVTLLSLTDEDLRGLRGSALTSIGAYTGAAVAAAFVLVMLPGMLRLIRAGGPRAAVTRAAARGVVAFLIIFPVIMAVGSIAALVARWLTGSPGSRVVHETLRMLTESAPAETHHATWWAVTVASVIVGAPLVEELVYRGFLQSAVRRAVLWSARPSADDALAFPPRRAAAWTAILLTSLLFAVMHAGVAEPHALPTLFVLSVCFGVVYERTGSLAAPIVMHALFNAANLAIALSTTAP